MELHDHDGAYVIFGAGGLGRELWGWIGHETGRRIRPPLAFVADDAQPGQLYDGIPIVRRDHFGARSVPYVNAVGDAGGRRTVGEGLAALGWEALSYVHESVLRGANVVVGQGVVVCPRSSLSSDCTLHRQVLVNVGCGVGHDVVVGAFSVLLGTVSLNGNVVVGEGATIGAGALVHPGRRIGDGATVGMGSAVFTDVRAGTTVVGNPARRLRG